MTTETLILKMNFPDGSGALTVNYDHPLVSVFRRAIKTGKYTGEWVYLIARPSTNEKPKLLGTVAWTCGERFLFFPGKRSEVQSTHLDKSLNGYALDHITLEIDESMSRFSEHNAILERESGKSRGQSRNGKVHDGMLHPWFSLLLPNLDGYEELPAILILEFPIPKTDLKRRIEAMMGHAQRTVSEFPSISSEKIHYYQLDVWAGRGNGWQNKHVDAIQWPRVNGVVEGHLGEQITVATQFHDVTHECGIVTILSRPSGLLRKTGLMHAAIEPKKSTDETDT